MALESWVDWRHGKWEETMKLIQFVTWWDLRMLNQPTLWHATTNFRNSIFYTFGGTVGSLLPVPSFPAVHSQSHRRCWSEWASRQLILVCSFILFLVYQQSDGSSDFIRSCCDAQHGGLRVSPEPRRWSSCRQYSDGTAWSWVLGCGGKPADNCPLSSKRPNDLSTVCSCPTSGCLPSTHFYQERMPPYFTIQNRDLGQTWQIHWWFHRNITKLQKAGACIRGKAAA